MLKIGTHDSATGEKAFWYQYPLSIFWRTQNKTIKEQYDAGCRLFDIRVKFYKGEWRCAHGIMKTIRTAEDIIKELDSFPDRCFVSITYEGKLNDPEKYLSFVKEMKSKYDYNIYGPISIKYGKNTKGVAVKYDTLLKADLGFQGGEQSFLALDARSWNTYIPIPILWDKICQSENKWLQKLVYLNYKKPNCFNEETYKYVDFL